MKRMKTLTAGIFLLSQAFSGAALAASVTLSGATVDFTFDDAMLGLFGPANVSGNSLYFTPTNFKAQSLNGAGFALTSETMNIKVSAHSDWLFSSIGLLEKGDYLLLGAGSMADVTGQMRIFDVATPLVDITTSIVSTNPLNQTGLPTRNWNAMVSTDLSAWTTTQTINVTIENLLLASTGAMPSLAFVEKKFVGLSVVTAPIPEAETYAMMLVGLGLVGFAAMRRRAALKSIV
ncbi:MAG: FxDxF family PEP-CTERM protein [Thiobacillus sp.]|nr:FxDxF family PEP-CTERM protein [Thiobacillus sp.]